MAEVLGVVTGSITLVQAAGQLGKALARLRGLWSDVNNASERVQDLLADLATFDGVLGEVESQLTDGSVPPALWNSSAARQSTRLCQDAITQLETVCQRLEKQFSKQKKSKRLVASIQVVLKERDLCYYEGRLDRAFSLLQMAHQCFLCASLKALPEIITQKVAVEVVRTSATQQSGSLLGPGTRSPPVELSISSEEEKSKRPPWARRRGEEYPDTLGLRSRWWLSNLLQFRSDGEGDQYHLHIHLPRWLANKAFDAYATRLMSGWQYTLRSRNILTKKAQRCIEEDNLERFQTLLAEGGVTPFDCDINGLTLSLISIHHAKRIIRFLVESRLCHQDVKEALFDGPLNKFCLDLPRMTISYWNQHFPDPIDPEVYYVRFEQTFCSESTLLDYQRLYMPDYPYLPPECHFQVGRWVVMRTGSVSPETFFRLTNPHGMAVSDLYSASAQCNLSILHSAAYAYGNSFSRLFIYGMWMRASLPPQDWSTALDQILKSELCIHDVELLVHDKTPPREYTPFGYFLRGSFSRIYFESEPKLEAFITFGKWCCLEWIRLLERAGVDLEEYGRRESELTLWENRNIFFIKSWYTWPRTDKTPTIRLISFQYGPAVSDWCFWLADEYEEAAKEFWDMVEYEPIGMPGSWCD